MDLAENIPKAFYTGQHTWRIAMQGDVWPTVPPLSGGPPPKVPYIHVGVDGEAWEVVDYDVQPNKLASELTTDPVPPAKGNLYNSWEH